jgi:drug/metabolite transporter (DMT)-like permease
MNWFLIAISAPVLWAVVNIADQYIVEKHAKGEHPVGALVLFSSLIGLLVALGIGLFTKGLLIFSNATIALLMLAGIVHAVWIMTYLRALELDEVSSIAAWFLTAPVFSYVLSYFVLGEQLTKSQLLGGCIILFGALILSLDFTKRKVAFKTKVGLLMLTSCFLIAVVSVLFKYVTVENSFWQASFWEYAGLGFAGVVLLIAKPSYRRAFRDMWKTGGTRILSLNMGSESLTIVANLLSSFAILLAPITLVYIVNSYQPVIVLLMTYICTRYFPNIITEQFAFRTLAPKLIAIGVMIVGTVFIFN